MEDVWVCQADLKEEPEDVAVEFPALQVNMIILAQLVVLVHTSHVLVVELHRLGTRNTSAGPVMLPALYSGVVLGLGVDSR